jgi:hypothetical protein
MGQMRTHGTAATATGAADKGSLQSELDAPLAVGGEVRPAFELNVAGSTAPPTHFVSARPDVILVRDGVLVGQSPGVSAVLVAMPDETVVDFLHVWVERADRVEVHGIDGSGADLGPLTEPLDLVAGERMRLVPHAYAAGAQLAGVATAKWAVDPPIAVVLREGLPNRVTLLARTAGTADVRVAMAGVTSHLQLKVIP